jgi:hypothetical protein
MDRVARSRTGRAQQPAIEARQAMPVAIRARLRRAIRSLFRALMEPLHRPLRPSKSIAPPPSQHLFHCALCFDDF